MKLEILSELPASGMESVPVLFVPGMAHDMMLEPGWRTVADRIPGWLESRGL